MFIKLNASHYNKWNDFCYRHERTWFFHTTHWQEYMQSSKHGVEFVNHSFFIETNGKITNIVPLIQEGNLLISPGFDDERDILKEVNRIALESGIRHIQVNCDIKSYLNASGYTCILTLNSIKPTKGHKAAIKKAEKFLTYRISEDIERFKKYYFNIAKKKTRPGETFRLLEQWIQQGYGTLLEALLDSKTVGYVYVLHYKSYAYYFASCTPKTYREYNVTHFLIWNAINMLKDNGIKYLEMGEMVFNSLNCNPSDKEKSISKFKKSFGGQVIVKPASEYFLDQEYMIDVYAERLHKYWEFENV